MAKLGDGRQLVSLTNAAIEFGIVTGALPEFTVGAPPDTSTNLNGDI